MITNVDQNFRNTLATLGFRFDIDTKTWSAERPVIFPLGAWPEWVPVYHRVAQDFRKLEYRIALADLKGLLQFSKVLGGSQSGSDADVVKFWTGHTEIAMTQNDNWVCLSMPFDGNEISLLKQSHRAFLALHLSIGAVLKGMDLDMVRNSDCFYAGFLRRIEEPKDAQSLPFSGDRKVGAKTKVFPEYASQNPRPTISNSFRDLPIFTSEIGLRDPRTRGLGDEISNRNGKLTLRGKVYDCKTDWHLHSDRVSMFIDLTSSQPDNPSVVPEGITIPFGVMATIRTAADLESIRQINVKWSGTDQPAETKDAIIQVTADSFELNSEAAGICVKFEINRCNRCGNSYWNFPQVDEVVPDSKWIPEEEFPLPEYVSAGSGHLFFDDCEEDGGCYCAQCLRNVLMEYVENHPAAKLSQAQRIVAELLSKQDPGLNLRPDNLDRISVLDELTVQGWLAALFIDYERDGRTITRPAGRVWCTDTGVPHIELKPETYLRFRSQES